MSEINTWTALHSAMRADGAPRRRIERATVRRIGEFARPHRRTIASFLSLATVSAILGVASPVLAGRAVDAIVEDGATRTVALLAGAIDPGPAGRAHGWGRSSARPRSTTRR